MFGLNEKTMGKAISMSNCLKKRLQMMTSTRPQIWTTRKPKSSRSVGSAFAFQKAHSSLAGTFETRV